MSPTAHSKAKFYKCKSPKISYASIIRNLNHEKLSLFAVWSQTITSINAESIANSLQY